MTSTHVVVVGAGFAGALAAAQARLVGHDVTLVERDVGTGDRRGLPQARQLHNILTPAQRGIEQVLPGFRDALLAADGVAADVAGETHVNEFGAVMPRRSLGLEIWSAPRTTIDRVMRSMLPTDMSSLLGAEVTGLTLGGDRPAVLDVTAADGSIVVAGDVVVDATGATSSADDWLPVANRPRLDTRSVYQWYATSAVRRPEDLVGDPTFWMVFPDPPDTRGCLVSPQGPEEWTVSVSGRRRDRAPRDPAEVLDHIAICGDAAVTELSRRWTPTSDVTVYRRPRAVRRRWDELDEPHPAYLPVGDRVATLNPLLGQGLSVAAAHVGLLAERLRGRLDTPDYLRAVVDAGGIAWDLDRIGDPGGPAPPDVDGDTLVELFDRDPDAHRRYVRMWHMLEPASTLGSLEPLT